MPDSYLLDEVKQLLTHTSTLTASTVTPSICHTPSSSLTFELSPPPSSTLTSDNRIYNTHSDTSIDSDHQIYAACELIVEQGNYYSNVLYAFRSISRAIPMLNTKDNVQKSQINLKTFEILEPEMKKLNEMLGFITHASSYFLEILQRLSSADTTVVRESLNDVLIKVLDVLLKIDNLKDMKACLRNDFARYKRSFYSCISDLPLSVSDAAQDSIRELQMFLGNPVHPINVIMYQLKDGVNCIVGHEDVIVEMMVLACDCIDNKVYVEPEEKYRYYRVLPYLMFIVDGDKKFNAFKSNSKKKNYPLARMMRIVKSLPFVPLVSDITLTLPSILATCKNYEEKKMDALWGGGNKTEKSTIEHYNLLTHWPKMRASHSNLITKLARVCNDDALDGLMLDTKIEDNLRRSDSNLRRSELGLDSSNSRRSLSPKHSDSHSSSSSNNLFSPNNKLRHGVDLASGSHTVSKLQDLFTTVLDATLHLRDSTCTIMEMNAWKYMHPASDGDLESRSNDDGGGGARGENESRPGNEYERVVRYNYSSAEKSVLVDMISMIKSLAALLQSKEARIAPLLRLYMHGYVQKFVGSDVVGMMKKAEVGGRGVLGFYLCLQDVCKDWAGAESKHCSRVKPKSKDKDKDKGWERVSFSSSFSSSSSSSPSTGSSMSNARLVGPGSSQLHLLRTMIRSMQDSNNRGHYTNKKDIDKDTLLKLETFYATSFSFPYLSALSTTVAAVSYLGDLWYRELYIEVTKCTQFPIEMSLPCILTEHVIQNIQPAQQGAGTGTGARTSAGMRASTGARTSTGASASASSGPGDRESDTLSKPSLMECVVYVMDVYNDAAVHALHTLQLQHIYDEIEAEVNLVFDQIVFLIGDEMYAYFKDSASSILLDHKYKESIEAVKGYTQLTVAERRFKIPASQRHVLLLGRSVDLNYLLTSHVNQKLHYDLESIIKRFESSDLSTILEIEAMLTTVQFTHARLSQILSVDDYETIFRSANSDVNARFAGGRIAAHVSTTILHDVVPNYSYNVHTERFVRSDVLLKPTGRETQSKMPLSSNGFGATCGKACEFLFKLGRGFVGRQHVEALLRLTGEPELNLLVTTFHGHIEEKLTDVAPYLSNLKEGLPPMKLPKFVLKSAGCYAAFEARLKQYFSYMGFLNESFQGFREIGNVVAFVSLVDSMLSVKQATDYINASSFMGVDGENLGVKGKRADTYDDFLNSFHRSHKSELRTAVETSAGRQTSLSSPALTYPNAKLFIPAELTVSPLHRSVSAFVSKSYEPGVSPYIRAPGVVSDLITMTEKSLDECEFTTRTTTAFHFGPALLVSISKSFDKTGMRTELGCDGSGNTGSTASNSNNNSSSNSSSNSAESVMKNEKSDEFYRLFSVLNCLMCMDNSVRKQASAATASVSSSVCVGINIPLSPLVPPLALAPTPTPALDPEAEYTKTKTDPQIFGHGFAIAGAVFLHLLHQKGKFEMLDFSYHVIKVSEHEDNVYTGVISDHDHDGQAVAAPRAQQPQAGSPVPPAAQGGTALEVETRQFVVEAKAQQHVHRLIFGLLGKCDPEQSRSNGVGDGGGGGVTAPRTYSPPGDDRRLNERADSGRYNKRVDSRGSK